MTLTIHHGVAGSGKTQIVVEGALENMRKGKQVLILTKVSSVTYETMGRMEGISFARAGNRFSANCIEVANIDSCIDRHLRLAGVDISDRATSFRWKCATLAESSDALEFFAGDPVRKVDVLYVDEFQDLDPVYQKLCTKSTASEVHILGDTLQSIFQDSDVGFMRRIREMCPDSEIVFHSECKRCPPEHVNFVNALHAPDFASFSIQPLKSRKKEAEPEALPVLFPYPYSRKMHTSLAIARAVSETVIRLLRFDPDLSPGDIAIISPTIKYNPLIPQLEHAISSAYSLEKINAKCVLVTPSETEAMDWSIARGNTVITSIHGDKGMGHRAVFVLGYSNGVIAREDSSNLRNKSMSYVALTRSTKYLFVWFRDIQPCPWIVDRIPQICAEKLAVLSWNAHSYTCDFHRYITEPMRTQFKYENNFAVIEKQIAGPGSLDRKLHRVSDFVQKYDHHLDIFLGNTGADLEKRTAMIQGISPSFSTLNFPEWMRAFEAQRIQIVREFTEVFLKYAYLSRFAKNEALVEFARQRMHIPSKTEPHSILYLPPGAKHGVVNTVFDQGVHRFPRTLESMEKTAPDVRTLLTVDGDDPGKKYIVLFGEMKDIESHLDVLEDPNPVANPALSAMYVAACILAIENPEWHVRFLRILAGIHEIRVHRDYAKKLALLSLRLPEKVSIDGTYISRVEIPRKGGSNESSVQFSCTVPWESKNTLFYFYVHAACLANPSFSEDLDSFGAGALDDRWIREAIFGCAMAGKSKAVIYDVIGNRITTVYSGARITINDLNLDPE